MALYSNLNPKQTIKNALLVHATGVRKLHIATAFFNNADDLINLKKQGIEINLVVRLGEGTCLKALAVALENPKISVRFFTGTKFHPKLYIFGDEVALVGSANATNAGFISNSEAAVTVPREHPDFAEIVSLFTIYWNEANVLTAQHLSALKPLEQHFKPTHNTLDNQIIEIVGACKPPCNFSYSKPKKDNQKLYVEDYERRYQNFRKAFDKIYNVYRDYGKRKPAASNLPLRIEVDQFVNYIREYHTNKENYYDQPLRTDDDLIKNVQNHIDEWLVFDFPYLDQININYKLINRSLGSISSIEILSAEEMFNALNICHAFKEQRRYHKGGEATFRKAFLNNNDSKQVSETVSYLLHGNDRFTERMATCIFDPAYKCNHFGSNSIQELLGWVNNEDIPIWNTRTPKSMRYLGVEIPN